MSESGTVGSGESPADEQPAGERPQTQDSDPGVGPAHYAGTGRGEDLADEKDEPGREDAGTKGASDRPTGTSTGRDVTSVDPDESA